MARASHAARIPITRCAWVCDALQQRHNSAAASHVTRHALDAARVTAAQHARAARRGASGPRTPPKSPAGRVRLAGRGKAPSGCAHECAAQRVAGLRARRMRHALSPTTQRVVHGAWSLAGHWCVASRRSAHGCAPVAAPPLPPGRWGTSAGCCQRTPARRSRTPRHTTPAAGAKRRRRGGARGPKRASGFGARTRAARVRAASMRRAASAHRDDDLSHSRRQRHAQQDGGPEQQRGGKAQEHGVRALAHAVRRAAPPRAAAGARCAGARPSRRRTRTKLSWRRERRLPAVPA